MSVELKLNGDVEMNYEDVPEMGVFILNDEIYIKVKIYEPEELKYTDVCISDGILEDTGGTSDTSKVMYLGQAKITIELE